MSRPLGGRQIGDQHRAMVKSGIDPAFRLAWIGRQMDEIEADLLSVPSPDSAPDTSRTKDLLDT